MIAVRADVLMLLGGDFGATREAIDAQVEVSTLGALDVYLMPANSSSPVVPL